ncbi:hypothetical protein Tco_1101144 [Tanacetum coccineum]
MVAFLEKPTGSAGFHQIIDFLNRSHICYAPTKKPYVCVSFIKQFWRSAEVSTAENGEVKITAIIDGHSMTITEGSLRRHLKLDDQDGISSIPNSEIFEQLALMGYHTDSDKLTFQKGAFSPQWRFLIHSILHCLSPKKTAWEQFSSNIATAVICLATNRKYNFSRMIFEHMVSNISSPHKFLMYPRFIQICLDMQRNQLQQHSRTYPVPSLSMKVFNNMKRPTKGFSGQEVALSRQNWSLLVGGKRRKAKRAMAEAKSTKEDRIGNESFRPIFEKVWDFNQHIEPMDSEHGSEIMKSPEKMKSAEKIEEEDVDTQEEMKEVVKEPGAKRKKSIPRKKQGRDQKMMLERYLDTDRFVEEVIQISQKKVISTSRPDGYDLILCGRFTYLFELMKEDEYGKMSAEYNVK